MVERVLAAGVGDVAFERLGAGDVASGVVEASRLRDPRCPAMGTPIPYMFVPPEDRPESAAGLFPVALGGMSNI